MMNGLKKDGLKNNKWIRRAVVCIWSYLCVLSFSRIIMLHGQADIFWGWKYFGYNIESVLLFGVTVWLLNRFLLASDRRMKVVSMVGGFLLSLSIVYGAYAHYVNDIFVSTAQTIQQFLMVLGMLALTMPIFRELLALLVKAEQWFSAQDDSKRVKGTRPGLFFLIMWGTIFAAYIPLFLAFWPGNFVFDARYQLQNVVEGYYTTHHPLIHTLLMGKAYQFGQKIGNVSAGYQIYTLIQMLILSSSFAYSLLYFYKKKGKTVFLVFSWLFFALFPMNALFSISATKDVLCAAFFLYFIVFLARLLVDKEKFGILSYIGMISSGVLVSLFRNNVPYAILVTAIFLVIFVKGWKEKGKIVLIVCAILLCSKGINHGLISYTNAKEAQPYRESLSVPLQGLARVASYRRDELDQGLYDEICLYIPEGNIPSYNPYCADPIKGEADEKLLKSNLFNFLKLWLKVGVQFPDEYVESFVTNTMGYWYPLNQGIYVSADISLYHTLIYGCEEQIEKRNYCKWANQFYSDLFWTTEYHYVPILGYFFRNAPYIWMMVLYILWNIYRKKKEKLLLVLLPVFYFGTCLLGPMAALRYVYSLIVCVPFFAGTLFLPRREPFATITD